MHSKLISLFFFPLHVFLLFCFLIAAFKNPPAKPTSQLTKFSRLDAEKQILQQEAMFSQHNKT